MEVFEVTKRIEQLKAERGWTTYKLAEEAGITQSTLLNMKTRGTLPSLTTLSCICNAFGMTLADFFADSSDAAVLLTEERKLLENYRKLSRKDKSAVFGLVEGLSKK